MSGARYRRPDDETLPVPVLPDAEAEHKRVAGLRRLGGGRPAGKPGPEANDELGGRAMSAAMTPDLEQARAYIEALTDSEGVEVVTFQTFSDVKNPKATKDPLARVLHGTLDQHAAELTRLKARGAGIFVMVNAGDGKGRAAENVTRIRAFVPDQDAPQKRPFALTPSFIVHTSPGKYQAYWCLAGDVPLEDFTPTQKRLAPF